MNKEKLDSEQRITFNSPFKDNSITFIYDNDVKINYEGGLAVFIYDFIETVSIEIIQLSFLCKKITKKAPSNITIQDLIRISETFNQYIKDNFDKSQPYASTRADKKLLKYIINSCYIMTIKDPKKLNKYTAFSPEVYGEVSFDTVDAILPVLKLPEKNRFIDLGSGVGQVVLQIAGTFDCDKCYGIEKADVPYNYSLDLAREFRNMMDWFGKSYSDFELIKGDFIDSQYASIINSSNFIFANNFTFGPQLNHDLKMKFYDLSDGCNILSTEIFTPLTFRVSARNLNDIGAMLHVKVLAINSPEAVSWTNKPLSFYLHVIDHNLLERNINSIAGKQNIETSNLVINLEKISISPIHQHGLRFDNKDTNSQKAHSSRKSFKQHELPQTTNSRNRITRRKTIGGVTTAKRGSITKMIEEPFKHSLSSSKLPDKQTSISRTKNGTSNMKNLANNRLTTSRKSVSSDTQSKSIPPLRKKNNNSNNLLNSSLKLPNLPSVTSPASKLESNSTINEDNSQNTTQIFTPPNPNRLFTSILSTNGRSGEKNSEPGKYLHSNQQVTQPYFLALSEHSFNGDNNKNGYIGQPIMFQTQDGRLVTNVLKHLNTSSQNQNEQGNEKNFNVVRKSTLPNGGSYTSTEVGTNSSLMATPFYATESITNYISNSPKKVYKTVTNFQDASVVSMNNSNSVNRTPHAQNIYAESKEATTLQAPSQRDYYVSESNEEIADTINITSKIRSRFDDLNLLIDQAHSAIIDINLWASQHQHGGYSERSIITAERFSYIKDEINKLMKYVYRSNSEYIDTFPKTSSTMTPEFSSNQAVKSDIKLSEK